MTPDEVDRIVADRRRAWRAAQTGNPQEHERLQEQQVLHAGLGLGAIGGLSGGCQAQAPPGDLGFHTTITKPIHFSANSEQIMDALRAQQTDWPPNKPSLSVEYCPPVTFHRAKEWPPGTPVWRTVLCRHPLRFLLRLPVHLWRALTWANCDAGHKPKRRSRREWRDWEDTWGPRDGNWERFYKLRKVYA